MGVVTKGKRDNTQVRLRWPDGSHSRWYLIHKLEEPPTPLTHLAETMAAAEAARAAGEEAREKGSQGTAGAGARAGVRAGQEPEPEPEPQAGAAGARAGTVPSIVERRPALLFLGHISPISARFFAVFSLFSPS